jgi:hypothetical protein
VNPRRAGIILGAVAVGAVLAAIATAFVVGEVINEEGRSDDGAWRTYRSHFLGFEIAYPGEWHIVEKLPPVDSDMAFVLGGVTISEQLEVHEGPHVLSYKNFQGDWCLRGKLVESEVVVSGIAGIETTCYACEPDAPQEACPADPYTILRIFGTVGRPDYYVVLGDVVDGDVETVRRIVESFRFID